MERKLNFIKLIQIFFTVYIETEGIYVENEKQCETRFGTSNYELDKSLLRAKNKKSNWVNEKQIRWKNKSLLRREQKKYSYLTDDNHEIKKAKDPKNVRLKNKINRFNRNT